MNVVGEIRNSIRVVTLYQEGVIFFLLNAYYFKMIL